MRSGLDQAPSVKIRSNWVNGRRNRRSCPTNPYRCHIGHQGPPQLWILPGNSTNLGRWQRTVLKTQFLQSRWEPTSKMTQALDEPTIDDRIVEQTDYSDRRASTRMPCSGSPEGQLRVGPRRMPIQLIDESAGGFLIETTRVPKNLGKKPFALVNHTGRHLVRVVWMREVEKGKFRIGLQRVPQLLDDRKDPPWFMWLLVAVAAWFILAFLMVKTQPNFVRRILNRPAVESQQPNLMTAPSVAPLSTSISR